MATGLEIVFAPPPNKKNIEQYLHFESTKILLALSPFYICVGYIMNSNQVITIIIDDDQYQENIASLIYPHEIKSIGSIEVYNNEGKFSVEQETRGGCLKTPEEIPTTQMFFQMLSQYANNTNEPDHKIIDASQRQKQDEAPHEEPLHRCTRELSPQNSQTEKITSILQRYTSEQLHELTSNNGTSLREWRHEYIENDALRPCIKIPTVLSLEGKEIDLKAHSDDFIGSLKKIIPPIISVTITNETVATITICIQIDKHTSVFNIEQALRIALLTSGLHHVMQPANLTLINQLTLSFKQAAKVGLSYFWNDLPLSAIEYFEIGNVMTRHDHPKHQKSFILLLSLLTRLYELLGKSDPYMQQKGFEACDKALQIIKKGTHNQKELLIGRKTSFEQFLKERAHSMQRHKVAFFSPPEIEPDRKFEAATPIGKAAGNKTGGLFFRRNKHGKDKGSDMGMYNGF